MEAENIAIASVDARNRVASHKLHLVGDGDARHGRSSNVVVGDEEGISDGAEYPNLMANVGQVRACRWLNFTKNLEFPCHRIYATWIWPGVPNAGINRPVDAAPEGDSVRLHGGAVNAIRQVSTGPLMKWSRATVRS
jgi:hypothetical protein